MAFETIAGDHHQRMRDHFVSYFCLLLKMTHWVVIFNNKQEVLDKVIPHPLVMIASDGLEGHPRNAGTYSRVLAQYVREKGTITLMDALRR